MDIKELKEKLTMKKEPIWKKRSFEEIDEYSKDYKKFIDFSKTERKAVQYSVKMLEEKGFKPLSYFEEKGSVTKGDKIYFNNRDKSLFAIILNDDLEKGVNIVGAHIDSPRIDFKPEPIYEDLEIAMAKTHYYGGIKKYQWLNIPLEIHGIVVKGNGEKVEISIGNDVNDPIFVISDILPHLDRNEKPIRTAIEAEKMNLILGSISASYDEEVKDGIKLNVLKILNEKYGIVEEDFISAEIEIVPAFEARDVGFDRSIMAAYGHDDRICAYTALTALLDSDPETVSPAVLLSDKEEIGSDGNTGAKNHYWIGFLKKILKMQGKDVSYTIEKVLENSTLLSSDVAAAIDPNYKDAHDSLNAPKLGYGIVITKYTGSGGKYSTNDANAELVGKIRKVLNDANVTWQTGELGRTDLGGGGTIAKFFAEKNLNVIDAGVALLGMHAPYELASKADIYETYLAYKAFINKFQF